MTPREPVFVAWALHTLRSGWVLVLVNRRAKPRQHVELAVLFQAEDALRRRCAIVASRLELSASALVLLEVACHADAALEDLGTLAEARGIVLDTLPSLIRHWLVGFASWAVDLWPSSASRGYRALLAEMRRDVFLAASLHRECLESGDRRAADWCALWTAQRQGLVNRLATTLAHEQSAVADA